MRLVCPNCGAHYEVDDRVIPDSGRDVQCSACGHAWYQMPPNAEEAPEPEPDTLASVDDETDTVDEIEAVADEAAQAEDETGAEADIGQMITATATAEPTEVADHVFAEAEDEAASPEAEPDEEIAAPAPEAEAEADEDQEDEEPTTDEVEEPTTDEVEAPARRALDDDLRAILQEEAEREMQARAAERSHEPEAMETQPDLGLDAGEAAEDERRRLARERMAAFQADDEDDMPEIDTTLAAGGAAVAGVAGLAAAAGDGESRQPRRDLFPDIEEINSTLDGYGPDERIDEDEYDARGRGGFGRAFLVVVLLVVLALALYVLAPRLAEIVPALEPALTGYVGMINGMRSGLEGLLGSVVGNAG